MTKKGDAPLKPAAKKPAVVTLTLHEFCARLSETVNRPELIGAFEFVERRAGRMRDTEQAYRDRFTAFTNSPA